MTTLETRPIVGDVVITDDFPLGVVLSVKTDYPAVNVAGISTLDDGSEVIGFPGTVDLAQIHKIQEHWDVDRICKAWTRFFEAADIVVPEETKKDFYERLVGRMATRSQVENSQQ